MRPPRTIVANRFEIHGAIGHGGMGTVYLARDLETDTQVAIKTLHQVAPAAQLRLKQEFRALSDVLHANLVRLHELFIDPEREDVYGCFFSMEYVPGRHVLDRLLRRPERPAASATWAGDQPPSIEDPAGDPARRPPLLSLPPTSSTADPEELASTFTQIAQAVDALHRSGKLHRDLKSANVLLTPEGRAVVLDFGLVMPTGADGDATGPVAGTPTAMAPEQMRGEHVGPAADWYAVGVLLYEALCGVPPFEGDFDAMLAAKSAGRYTPLPASVDPALADLCDALLQVNPARRPGLARIEQVLSPRTARRPERRASTRDAFIGRFPERSILRDAWARACAGETVAVIVRGRSGIGKSALVHDLVHHVASNPANLVLSGRCHEREQIPHKALDAVIDSLARHLARLPEDELAALVPVHSKALARLFPVLAGLPAFGAGEPLPADPRSIRTFAAIALEDLLRRIAKRWRLLITVDDLQWGDADSAALILRVLTSARPPPLLLLGAHRDDSGTSSPVLQALAQLRSNVAEGARGPQVEDLRLGPLSDADARQLLRSAGLVVDEDVLVEAGGDPYLLAEATVWMPSAGPVRFSGIPEMLRARLDAAPAPLLGLVQAVALAGHPTPLALLPPEMEDVRSELRAATQLRLLRVTGEAPNEWVDCYHNLVRAVVLEGMPPEVRRAHHAGLAQALELAETPDAESLSLHQEGAGDPERAAIWALRAARQAERALAFRHAAGLYRRYLALAGPGSVRGDAELSLAESLANSGDGRAAADAFLAAANAQPENALSLRTRAAEELMMSGHLDAGLGLAATLLGEVGLGLEASSLVAVSTTAWRRLRLRLRGVRPGGGEQTAAEVERLDVCWAMVTGLQCIDPIRSSAFQAKYMLLALDLGEPTRIARGFAAEAAAMSLRGERSLVEGLERADRAKAMAEHLDDAYLLALTAQERGTLYGRCGRWREAVAEFNAALAVLATHCPGAAWERSTSELSMVDQLVYLGDVAQIAQVADRVLRDGTASGNLYQLTIAMRPLHLVRLAADEPDRALREVTAAISGWPAEGRMQHFNACWALSQVDLYAGRASDALRRLEASWDGMRWSMMLTIECVRVEMTHARGRARLASASGDDATERLAGADRDALSLLEEAAPWAHPLGLLLRAGVRNARGERPVDDLVAAEREFDALGMALYAAAARRRLAELNEDPPAIRAAFKGLKVVHPGRMCRMLAPGFPGGPDLASAPRALRVGIGRDDDDDPEPSGFFSRP